MLKNLGITIVLTLLAVFTAVTPSSAQECQGCGNIGGCQWCTGDDENNELFFTVPECHVVECFCQLSGDDCSTFTYSDFEADIKMTPAGTLVAEYNVTAQLRVAPEKNCSGLVVASAETALERPDLIRLIPLTRTTEQ